MGENFTLALTSRLEIYSWGQNDCGQLGHGDTEARATPSKIKTLQGVVRIDCGLKHVLAYNQSGYLYGWGQNAFGQIGMKTEESDVLSPIVISQYSNAQPQFFSCGAMHSFVLSRFIPEKSPTDQQLDDLIKGKSTGMASDDETERLKEEVTRLRKQLLYRQDILPENSQSDLESVNDNLDESSCDEGFGRALVNRQKKDPSTSNAEGSRPFHPEFEIPFSDLKFDDKLSEGGYGIVYKGRWQETKVAIKQIKVEIVQQQKLDEFKNECAVMEVIRHPNIVQYLGACTKRPDLCIVLEYCDRGSLWQVLHDKKIKMTWEFRKRLALDIAKGVYYLHTRNPPILHRDLKSLNVVLDRACNAKLADFGWTRQKAKKMTAKIGTYQWMAPEVIAAFKYSEKADVFSYGIILWELLTRKPPYYGIDGTEVSLKVVKEDFRPPVPKDEKNYPAEFVDLMKRCWEREPSQRPYFDEIIEELNDMDLSHFD